jgi:hypothetical protein
LATFEQRALIWQREFAAVTVFLGMPAASDTLNRLVPIIPLLAGKMHPVGRFAAK